MAASPASSTFTLSPNLSDGGAELLLSELRKLQTAFQLKQFLHALLENHILFNDLYRPNSVDDLCNLLAFDAFVIMENALKLKCPTGIFTDVNCVNRAHSSFANKFTLPCFHLALVCSALLYISDDDKNPILYPLVPTENTPMDMSFVRGRLLDFTVTGPGYWGDSDWGLERVIRNLSSSDQSFFLGGAIEKLITLICNAQLLIEWKVTNPGAHNEDVMFFAEAFVAKSKKIAAVDLVSTGVAAYGQNNNFIMPPRNTGLLLMPSDANLHRHMSSAPLMSSAPNDANLHRLNDANLHRLMSSAPNDANLHRLMSIAPNDANLHRAMSIDANLHRSMSIVPNDTNLHRASDYHLLMPTSRYIPQPIPSFQLFAPAPPPCEDESPRQPANWRRFKKEAKSVAGRFNALGASFVSERFPSSKPLKKATAAVDEEDNTADHDNMSTISSIGDSLIIVPSTNISHNKVGGREDGNYKFSSAEFRSSVSHSHSDTESDGASKDSDSATPKSSHIVRRVKRKFEDKPPVVANEAIDNANQNVAVYKIAAKGIQITPVGTFRVQLNKTKNSTTKFTKNVQDLVEALWLFEIAVLICDRPKELGSLLKSGNYQYLLENNYIRNSVEYKTKLGDYILLLHTKKILKSHLAEDAVAIFSNLTVDETRYVDHMVDPVDLQNLLSLKG